ncbi:MAG: hypothetical protein EBZ36_17115 [Acidobacteria bacterium]|nr:hypothetical protein [Acidobacteriota bacterium]
MSDPVIAGSGPGRETEEVTRLREGSASRRFDEVSARLRERGTLAVIVRLRMGNGTESVDRAQEALIAAMSGYDPTSIKRFRHIPYLRMRVDPGGMERLRRLSLVEDIQEDHAVHPNLVARNRVIKAAAGRPGSGGATGLAVALVGAGVDRNHPELAGRLAAEGCFSTSDSVQGVSSLCAGDDRTYCVMTVHTAR